MATSRSTNGVFRHRYPMSSTTTDYFWPTPSSPQSSDYFRFPIWDKSTTDLPKALEELHLERSYLVDSLHRQSQIANQLTRKIPELEGKLQHLDLRPLHRKIRKQLGWIKSRLGQSSQQEQTISSRLNQLGSEIQAREQWTHIEQAQQRLEMLQYEKVLGYQRGLCDGLQMRLDPEQPEFQPHVSPQPIQPEFQPHVYSPPIFSTQWHLQGMNGQTECPELSELPEGQTSPKESIPSQHLGKYNTHNPHLSRRSASMGCVDLRLLATNTNTLLVPVSTLKRHSFPAFPGCSGNRTSTAREQAEVEEDEIIERRSSNAGAYDMNV